MALRTDRKSSFDARDMPNIVGYDLAETTVRTANENHCGRRIVTNPLGGLLSKGHPLGATGVALHHNLGLGGACVVGAYQRM
jgi:hypothetical protein